MLKAVLDVAVPALVFLTMAVVGSGLTGEDFRRVARRPGLVAAATAGQLLVLPVLLEMALRHYRPDFARRHEQTLLWASVAALAALVGFVIVQEAEHFVGEAAELGLGVAFLTASAMTAGYGTAWACGGSAQD